MHILYSKYQRTHIDGVRKKACAQMRSLWDGLEVMQPPTIDRYCCDPKICIVHFFLFYSVMARAYIYYPIVIGTLIA